MSSTLSIGFWRKKLSGETGIVTATLLAQNVLRIVGSMIFTRLLTSEAFGIISIITSVNITFSLLTDIGISAFLIRHKSVENKDFINEVWTLKLIRCIVLMSAVILFSGPISNFIEKPELQLAICVNALFFLLDGFDSLGHLIALKDRNQKRISKFELLNQVITLIIPMLLALAFRSFWAILIGNIICQTIKVAISYHLFPNVRHKWKFSANTAKDLWSYSRFITVSTIITLIINQSDKVIFIKIMPLSVFGLYVLAAGLAAVPGGLASSYGARVLLPRYAELYRNFPEQLPEQYYKQKKAMHLLFSFGIAMLAGIAPLIISILYDQRYQGVTLFFQLFLINSYFALGNTALFELLLCTGSSKFVLSANIVRLIYLSIFGYVLYNAYGPIGLICVIATMELVAQLYGWIELKKLEIFSFRNEILILSVAPVGFFVGLCFSKLGFETISGIKYIFGIG